MASKFPSCVLGSLLCQTLRYPVVANLLFLFIMTSLPVKMNSIEINFPGTDSFETQGSAVYSSSQIQLTPRNQSTGSLDQIHGRALYRAAVPLWDASTKRMADFSTSFKFSISSDSSNFGDGLAFLLVPNNTQLPAQAGGGSLGMYSVNTTTPAYLFDNNTKIVAIEFDTFQNPWDPSAQDHIGIDVSSVKSLAYANVPVGLVNKTSQVFISYNSTTKNLSVSLSVNESSVPFSVSHIVDLSTILPEWIQVGFSASTGDFVELHNILSWSFNSTLEETATTNTTQC